MLRPPMPPLPSRSGPSLAGRALAIIIGALLLVVAVLLYPTFAALNDAIVHAIADHKALIGGVLVLLFIVALASVPLLLFTNVAKQWSKAQQAAILKAPNGMPIHIRDVSAARRKRDQDGLVASLLATSLEQVAAEKLAAARRQFPQLHSYHEVHHNDAPQQQLITAEEAPIALSTESEWLAWADRAPHLMVAGRTEAGKTTTVEAILARRILAGDLVLVIDPHYQAGKWLGATAIGGGRNYEACYHAFDAARALLDRRYKSFDAGTRTEDFKRVTIVVDEVPAIIAHAQSQNKAMLDRWLLFATSLGSEARKVRISVVLLTQSPLVRDIGISSAMRENFTRIALGDTAADLLREEPNAAHKQALLDLLRGRPYPAAMEFRNNWYALRNDDIRDFARTNGTVPRAPTLLIGAATPMRRAITTGLTPPRAPVIPITARVPVRPAPPTVPFEYTVKDQILIVLGAQPERHLTISEIAAAIRVDLYVTRTEIDNLFNQQLIARRKCKGRTTKERYEYRINQTNNQPATLAA